MTIEDFKSLDASDLRRLLKRLSYREREILKLLSGWSDGYSYTEEEVAHIFKADIPKVRETASKALSKLQTMVEFETPRYVSEDEMAGSPLLGTTSKVTSIFPNDAELVVEGATQASQPSSGIDVTLMLPEFCDDEAAVNLLVDLYQALNDAHIAAGGTGLIVDKGESKAGVMVGEGVPQ